MTTEPNSLQEYIIEHTDRSECDCDKYADLFFFKVATKNNPSAEELIRLIRDHRGVWNQLNLFDGEEHGYIEIGAWLGSQQLAFLLMGLGSLLDVFELATPNILPKLDPGLKEMMAGMGMISICAKEKFSEKYTEMPQISKN